ncbi:MAG: LysR substrate-binding domain-containing protein [Pseudomonadota bacterium]
MPNLNDLYWFAQVVERKGFSEAARAIGAPKSTLSKRVAALEQQLGVRLIQRNSRNFVVTEIGEQVYRHAAAMLAQAEAAQDLAQGYLSEPSGTVRLTASMTTAQVALVQALPRFGLAYPKVAIALHVTNRPVDLVQEGFDIAVRAHYAPLPDSELIQRRLGFAPILLVASPGYLKRRGTPVQPADLAVHDGLLTGPAILTEVWRLQGPAGNAVEVRPALRFAADEPAALVAAAIAGLGIARLPHSLCQSHLEQGSLVRILPEWSAGGAAITMLTLHRRGQLPAVRALIDFLAEELPPLMGLRDSADIPAPAPDGGGRRLR